MLQLLSGAAMAVQPLAMDAMVSALRVQVKLQHEMLKDAPASVRQEPLLAPILSLQPLDVKIHEALKAFHQVVKLVAQPSPKIQSSKLTMAPTLAKPQSASSHLSAQASPYKHKSKTASSSTKTSLGSFCSFQGQHPQLQDSFSSGKSFSHHPFHNAKHKH